MCSSTDARLDGEQILGIKDQGVGGVLISVAKLALTTLCAGIHPNRTLPVVLDCGTNNEDLLIDDLYLGLREKRVRGERYDEFVDTFVKAARELYPRAYIHFEDFGLDNGRSETRLLFPLSRFQACRLTIYNVQHGVSLTDTVRKYPASTMMSREPAA